MKLYERIENNNFDEIDKNRAIELIEGGNGHLVYNENYFKLQKENEELKNNIRKNENELEFDVNCDWIALQKMLDESEKSNEYISYKNEKWIKEKYCIPIQKIKAKIEELDIAISECIYLDDDDEEYKKAVEKDKLCLLNQKRALQELLDGNDTNVGSIGNSIEEDIKILEEFKTNGYSILLMKYGDRIKTNFKLAKAIENILSAYKRVLKENERYKKSDYETICLENNELREITDRIQSEYNDLLKDNFKLKNELETKRKEYNALKKVKREN